MSPRFPLLVGLTTLFACGFEAPLTGEWSASDAVEESNDCNLEAKQAGIEPLSGFFLQIEPNGDYELLRTDKDAEEVECEIDEDKAITCDTTKNTVAFGSTSLDTITDLVVAFDSDKKATVTETVSVDCVGDIGCQVAKNKTEGEFPCEIVTSYTSEWQSEDVGGL